jgi:hypothetical protein
VQPGCALRLLIRITIDPANELDAKVKVLIV